MRVRPARAAVLAVAVVVTVFFTWLAVRDVQFAEVWEGLREASPWWVLAAFVAFAAAIFIRAVRWRALFAAETRPPLGPVSAAVLVGYFFNTILPARAGEAARIVALGRSTRTPRAEAAASVVVERGYDMLILLVLFFLAYPWLPEVSWIGGAAVLAAAVAAALVALAVASAVWGERPFRLLLRPLARVHAIGPERAERAAESLARGLAGVRHPGRAISGIAWTALSWVALSLSNWLALRAFDLELSPAAGLLIAVATGVALVLPAAPAGLGVFEGATVLALDAYDVSDSRALSYALVLHALNFLPFLVAGPLALRATARLR